MLAKSILGLIFFLFFSASSIGAQYWPTKKWERSSPQAQGFEPNSIDEMFQFMQKRKFPIDSVVIVKNGYLIGGFTLTTIIRKQLVIYILLQKASCQRLLVSLLITVT